MSGLRLKGERTENDVLEGGTSAKRELKTRKSMDGWEHTSFAI